MLKQIGDAVKWGGRLWKRYINVDIHNNEPGLSPEGNRVGDKRIIKYEYDEYGNVIDSNYEVNWDGYCWRRVTNENR